MKARATLAGLVVPLLLLLPACDRAEVRPSATTMAPPTAVATPTLLPNLPTSTPWSGEELVQTQAQGPVVSPTPKPTATPRQTPTATPVPAERLELGQAFLENEDYSAAAEQMQAGLLSQQLSEEQRQEALMVLGQAQLASGESTAAGETFGALLSDVAGKSQASQDEATVDGDRSIEASKAYYFLGQTYADQGDCGAAVRAYGAYLETNAEMAAYVQPLIAECYLALDDHDQAIRAYETAVAAGAHPAVIIDLRYRLAQLYVEAEDYLAAIDQYEAVLNKSEDHETLGEALYLAGTAEIAAGNLDAGYGRYQEAVAAYPEAYESYLALQALIEAGYQVNDYHRGLVDYHANAFEPAISAFGRYLESDEVHEEDAHLYLAWSLEGLGNVPAALDQLQVYIDAHLPERGVQDPVNEASPEAVETPVVPEETAAARGLIERAKMMARAGMLPEAAETYSLYVDTYPDGEHGPFAAWWRAAIAEQLGELEIAIAHYQELAELYPEHEDADEALYRAGLLSLQLGDRDEAMTNWETAVRRYPDKDYGAGALIELLELGSETERETWLAQAANTQGSGFYQIRARHIASDTLPFEAPPGLKLELSPSDQQAAEAWLRALLNLPDEADVSQMSAELANDGRLNRGQKLWQLDLRQEAKRELEDLRLERASDPLESYQLALFFSQLGLYRSSILAAISVMDELNVDVFDAPRFIAGLAYPTYYSDLITDEAQNYGYDPLLHFALIRQESLFESSATSGAAAQGLSQVIPDTGAYIAERLGWTEFVNEDLYRPYVGIAFGAYYLAQQLEAFDGDVAAALSAYNAGPGNAARWYEAAGEDIDEYMTTVDFPETRQYIARIYAGQAIYRHLYGTG